MDGRLLLVYDAWLLVVVREHRCVVKRAQLSGAELVAFEGLRIQGVVLGLVEVDYRLRELPASL
jgi:hypothetical protein